MIRYCAAAVAVSMLAVPAMAQDADARPSITVLGRGHVETPPDSFRMTAELEGRGADQVAALRALSTVQSQVGEVEKLEGLERARLTTGAPAVSPTFHPQCGGTGYDRDTDSCPVVGYVASMRLTLEAGPVARAGDAMSLASERGARNASVQAFYLAEDASQTAEAQQAAFANARQQADILAAAAGQRIVRVLRLQNPDANRFAAGFAGNDALADVVVTGARSRPSISLDVAPPPVRTEAQIVATFEID
jgi:uncharacterized protein YggE